jgi:hypothetical protein
MGIELVPVEAISTGRDSSKRELGRARVFQAADTLRWKSEEVPAPELH